MANEFGLFSVTNIKYVNSTNLTKDATKVAAHHRQLQDIKNLNNTSKNLFTPYEKDINLNQYFSNRLLSDSLKTEINLDEQKTSSESHQKPNESIPSHQLALGPTPSHITPPHSAHPNGFTSVLISNNTITFNNRSPCAI